MDETTAAVGLLGLVMSFMMVWVIGYILVLVARWKVFVFIFSGVSINFRWVISENLVSVNMNIKSYSVHP